MSAANIGGVATPAPQAAAPAAPTSTARSTPVSSGIAAKPAEPNEAPGQEELRDAVGKIEESMAPAASDLRFSIDEDTGITVVKLIDTQTQTIIRQIPTQEVIEISKALDKMQGLLVKDKA